MIEIVVKRLTGGLKNENEPLFVGLEVGDTGKVIVGSGKYGRTVAELADNLKTKLASTDWSISTDRQLRNNQLKPLSRQELTRILDLVDNPSK